MSRLREQLKQHPFLRRVLGVVEKVAEPSPIISIRPRRDLIEARERVNHECFLRGVREWIGEIFEILRRDRRVTI